MKILSAWIEQVIKFDDDFEFEHYVRKLKNSERKFDLESVIHDEQTGEVSVHVRKQYNNNDFPARNKGKDE